MNRKQCTKWQKESKLVNFHWRLFSHNTNHALILNKHTQTRTHTQTQTHTHKTTQKSPDWNITFLTNIFLLANVQ